MADRTDRTDFSLGLVTARDASTLRPGELVTATGCEYRIGAPHVYKQPGRTSTSTAINAPILAIHKLQYDRGDDVLVASGSGTIYESAVSITPAFTATLLTGLSTSVIPQFSNYSDQWVMCNGVDVNYLREPNPTGASGIGKVVASGTHTGANNATSLTTSGLTDSAYIGYTVKNTTDGSHGKITANTTTVVTAILIGGTDNDWDTSDAYQIVQDNWRALGMTKPSEAPALTYTAGASSEQRATGSVGTGYTNTANVVAESDLDTYAHATVSTVSSKTTNFNFTTASIYNTSASADRWLRVKHSGTVSSESISDSLTSYKQNPQQSVSDVTEGIQRIEVSVDNGTTWTVLSELAMPYSARTSSYNIAASVTLTTSLLVRATTTMSAVSDLGWGQGRVYDIMVNKGATVLTTFTNDVTYAYTEYYVDGNDVVHESALSPFSTVPAATATYGVTLTLPGLTGAKNSFSQKYIIYRSIDEAGGGYPYMYVVGEVSITSTSFLDDFSLSLTLASDKLRIVETLTVSYPDGASLAIQVNMPPPLAKMALEFQGCMVYLPSSDPRRLFYSIPATISAVGMEQVPELYYLEFPSERNDALVSMVRCNSGRTLLVFFETGTKQVAYLPQATDPSIFDTRIVEYVSTQRGAAGRLCTVEFDMGSGRTMAAAVDALGLWVTDGVSVLSEWTRDIDWTTAMSGVTLADAELINNPEMRRLEFLYTSAGTRYEYHFFYGRMKQNEEGLQLPIVTGPHPMGVRCKHYNTVSGVWKGWSGGDASSSTDDVYIERSGNSDASNGYPATANAIPFQVKLPDLYVGGFSRAHLVQFGYPKFATGSATVTLDGSFRRDGMATAATAQKTFTVGTNKKIYWHRYADRHTVTFSCITTTSMPALIAYEYTLRDAGESRDT